MVKDGKSISVLIEDDRQQYIAGIDPTSGLLTKIARVEIEVSFHLKKNAGLEILYPS